MSLLLSYIYVVMSHNVSHLVRVRVGSIVGVSSTSQSMSHCLSIVHESEYELRDGNREEKEKEKREFITFAFKTLTLG